MSLHSAKLVNVSFGLRPKLARQIKLWSYRVSNTKSEVTHCSIYLSVHSSICVRCLCLSVSLSVCLNVCLSLSVCLCLSHCLSECLSICLFACLSVCLFACLLDVCLRVCLAAVVQLPRPDWGSDEGKEQGWGEGRVGEIWNVRSRTRQHSATQGDVTLFIIVLIVIIILWKY